MDDIYYWDSSAVLSLLFKDAHSLQATAFYRKQNTHIISSLVIAEVLAVLARIEREHHELKIPLEVARKSFEEGHWKVSTLSPEFNDLREISQKFALRGADLWHLCLVIQMKQELPSISMITFDKKLWAAAKELEIASETTR